MDDLRAAIESAMTETKTETETPEVQQEVAQEIETPKEETKPERARTPDGKFAAKDPQEATETTQEAPKEEEKPQVKASPKSWRKEIADAHWNNIPDELKDEILRREEAVEKGFEGYKTNAEVGVKFKEVLQPYMATINQFGVPPEKAVQHLFNADHQLRYGTQQQKVEMAVKIFSDYGIDPNQVFQRLQNGAPQVNPELAPVYQQLTSTQQQLQQLVAESQQREMAAYQSEIERAKQGKPHFDLVRDEMAALLQAGLATNLDDAYDKAVWAKPDLRQSLLHQEIDKSKQAEQAKRAQNAAVSVKGSTPSSAVSGLDPNNIRGLIASQFRS